MPESSADIWGVPGLVHAETGRPVPRWARASASPGDLCAHAEHAPSDFIWPEPRAEGKPVAIWRCGICWPLAPTTSTQRRTAGQE